VGADGVTLWFPAWIAALPGYCAVFDCTFPRWDDPNFGPRRWCSVHCALRDQEITASGGGLVLEMEDYK
jgi:hypothetical protein